MPSPGPFNPASENNALPFPSTPWEFLFVCSNILLPEDTK